MGREARLKMPRDLHGTWDAQDDRADPLDLLEAQAATRAFVI